MTSLVDLIEAVIFDLDGLLIDSESVWDQARREYVAEHGGTWREEATRDDDGDELARVVALRRRAARASTGRRR